jgi:hypothetical protein
VLATFTAHGSSKSLTTLSQQSPISRSPSPAAAAELAVGFLLVTVGPSRRSVCRACAPHRTCPSIGVLHRVLRVTHRAHVSRLSAWGIGPYPPGYGFPSPFGGWRSLLGPSGSRRGVGLSVRSACRLVPDPVGVATFRCREMRLVRVPSIPRGPGCPGCTK